MAQPMEYRQTLEITICWPAGVPGAHGAQHMAQPMECRETGDIARWWPAGCAAHPMARNLWRSPRNADKLGNSCAADGMYASRGVVRNLWRAACDATRGMKTDRRIAKKKTFDCNPSSK
eukprot:6432217-Pyramimonas_sp.AAC.2